MTSLLMGPQGAVNRILSEASHSHKHTHMHADTQVWPHHHHIPGFTLLLPSPPKSLPLSHFNTLSAPSPPLLPHPSQAPLFTTRERQLSPTTAAVRSQACWLQLSASHWFQQSVSLLHPLKPARSHHWAKDYGKGHWHVSGWAGVKCWLLQR